MNSYYMPHSSLNHLLTEVCASLSRGVGKNTVLNDVLDHIKTFNASDHIEAGNIPTHHALLDSALSQIDAAKFPSLKTALAKAKDQLIWRVDDGKFYEGDADVGDGYRDGNMHALLIGPKNAPFIVDDFLLGFYLLAPNTLYRDHKHLAPEVYFPLTGPQGWRFEQGPWQDHEAGHMIYNPPNVTHATRVYDTPFLALFIWAKDIQSNCHVVDADDWDAVEAALTEKR